MKAIKFKIASTLSALLCAFSSTTVWAQQSHITLDKNGVPIFKSRIFSVGHGPYAGDDDQIMSSTWSLNSIQIGQVISAVDYWGELIQATPGRHPALINIGTLDEEGASALSPLAFNEVGAGTQVRAAITNQHTGELSFDAHGFIVVGKLNWADGPFRHSQIVLTPDADMTTVVIHEVAHALGIGSELEYEELDESSMKMLATMPDKLSLWEGHLYDDNHQPARSGQVVYCDYCENIIENKAGTPLTPNGIFDARKDKVHFNGTHVNDVLAGAMPGVPLTLYGGGWLDMPVWSHLELKNSLMSHQNYRNYTNLMEAEVAVLQDLGYQIDRRNFWGYSVYGDNQYLVNDKPFFSRNAAGTAYRPNTYNTATLGLGLHVYGSNNTIIQRADLLSIGAGGGGIRIDGQGNSLTVLPGTRVHANGAQGRGVMFAYGKDHSFTHRGDIEAMGENGIAASFDFGHNSIGDATEYRGSYLRTSDLGYSPDEMLDLLDNEEPSTVHTEKPWTPPMLEELNGPLVKNVDLTGRLAGKTASIYISDNAYVGAINVMGRAQLLGDIISEYNQVDESDQQRLTTLAFGYHSDGEGRSTGAIDSTFSHSYKGNIVGINNLSLQLVGGSTQISGNHALYDVAVAQNATLSATGDFHINPDGVFANQGKVASYLPGSAIRIYGLYTQSPTGELQVAFDSQKNTGSLIVHGQANIDGTLSFAPARDYYVDGFNFASDQWLQAETLTGTLSPVTTQLESPTLTTTATKTGDNRYHVAVRRVQAYSPYGTTPNSHAVGIALDSVTTNPTPSSRAVLAALDFSAADGSTIREALPQLTGEVYASTKGILVNTSDSTRTAVSSRLRQAFGGESSSPIVVATPDIEQLLSGSLAGNTPTILSDQRQSAAWGYSFGNWRHQKGNSNVAKTTANTGGFLTGIDASVADDWRVGLMAGYSHSSIKVRDRFSSGKSDNYTLGAYTGTEWPTPAGALALRSGLSYTWHSLEMNRNLSFNGFNDKLSSDYNAGSFQLFGELGYKTKLTEQSMIEPYANLAFVNLRTDKLFEQGKNGAALSVRGDSMNTTFSTLGVRSSTQFSLGNIPTAARADIGWRRAFGDTATHSMASLGDSAPFAAVGSAIGKDTAIFETGLDFNVTKRTTLGIDRKSVV